MIGKQQLKILAKIAETEPQAAYSAFVGGFKGKLTYLMRTIPELDEFLKPIEDTIRNELIPALTGCHICSDNERKLLSLPSRYDGLGNSDILSMRTTRIRQFKKSNGSFVEIYRRSKFNMHSQ